MADNGTPEPSVPPPEPENLRTAFTDAMVASETSPEPESSPEATPQPATPETPQPAPNPLIDYARSAGVDVGEYTTDADFGKAFIGQYQQQSQLANWAKQLLPHADKITAALQQREPEPEPQAEWDLDQHFAKAWDIPEYNSSWDNMIQSGAVQKDASGRYAPAEGFEYLNLSPELRELNEFESKRGKSVQDLFYGGNFYKNVWDKFQEPIERMIQDKAQALLEERFGQESVHDTISQFESQNEWLYDGQNMELVNGQPMRKLTEQGRKFFDTVGQLRESGMTDASTVLKYASQLVPPPAQEPTPAAPAATPEQASEQQAQSFLDTAMQRAQHSPSGGGASATHPETEPINVTRNELHNMFRNAWAAQQSAGAA